MRGTRRRPERVFVLKRRRGGVMPSGIGGRVVDSDRSWLNNTDQRIVIQNNKMRGAALAGGRADPDPES